MSPRLPTGISDRYNSESTSALLILAPTSSLPISASPSAEDLSPNGWLSPAKSGIESGPGAEHDGTRRPLLRSTLRYTCWDTKVTTCNCSCFRLLLVSWRRSIIDVIFYQLVWPHFNDNWGKHERASPLHDCSDGIFVCMYVHVYTVVNPYYVLIQNFMKNISKCKLIVTLSHKPDLCSSSFDMDSRRQGYCWREKAK